MPEDQEFAERKRLYERTRDELAVSSRSVAESYDRALLTLSSAFLGGSLAFTDSVVGLNSATSKWMLYVAWLCLVLTILVTLGSFVFSLLSYESLRKAARKYYLEGDEPAWSVSSRNQKQVLSFVVAAGVLFGAGIVLLALFVILNL